MAKRFGAARCATAARSGCTRRPSGISGCRRRRSRFARALAAPLYAPTRVGQQLIHALRVGAALRLLHHVADQHALQPSARRRRSAALRRDARRRLRRSTREQRASSLTLSRPSRSAICAGGSPVVDHRGEDLLRRAVADDAVAHEVEQRRRDRPGGRGSASIDCPVALSAASTSPITQFAAVFGSPLLRARRARSSRRAPALAVSTSMSYVGEPAYSRRDSARGARRQLGQLVARCARSSRCVERRAAADRAPGSSGSRGFPPSMRAGRTSSVRAVPEHRLLLDRAAGVEHARTAARTPTSSARSTPENEFMFLTSVFVPSFVSPRRRALTFASTRRLPSSMLTSLTSTYSRICLSARRYASASRRRADVGLAHDLDQRNAGAIEVDRRRRRESDRGSTCRRPPPCARA